MAGACDPDTNTVWWGTANPDPQYEWSGDNWKTEGPRPGTNLYTSSVLLPDPDSGKLKAFHQKLPHDAWDFDSAVGEFMFIERGGKKYVVHPNKGGFIFAYDQNGKVQNVYEGVDNVNFVKDIDGHTGELIGRRDLSTGEHKNLCPGISGGYSWPSGTYDPRTGLFYRVGFEWCEDVSVLKTKPITEPVDQLDIGANFKMHGPGTAPPHGEIRARYPMTGKVKFEIPFEAPPHASLLSAAGDLLFVSGPDGMLTAYDATTGRRLWSHNDGQGHDGGN